MTHSENDSEILEVNSIAILSFGIILRIIPKLGIAIELSPWCLEVALELVGGASCSFSCSVSVFLLLYYIFDHYSARQMAGDQRRSVVV